MYEFFRAAMPWVAGGIVLAVLAAKGANKKKDDKSRDNYGTEGMCIVMCIGTALGSSLWNNPGIGISLGMLIGLALGSFIRKEHPDEGHDPA